jgi:hypothetical protein
MSGTAALAAARRRRAGPTNDSKPNMPPLPPSKSSYNSNSISNSNSTTNPASELTSRPINPGELLIQHNKLIAELKNDIAILKQTSKPTPNDPTQLEYFKGQYAALNEEVKEMKKVLIKIQTFSMETNLELLKMKRLLKQDQEEEKEDKNILLDKV